MTYISRRKSLWLGVIYATSTAFMIAVMNLFAKLLAEQNFHAIELVCLRNFFGLVIISCIILCCSKGPDLFKTNRIKSHFTRSLLGTLGVGFIFAAYAYLPLTSATVLLFTSSLMIPIFGWLVLNERVGPYRWLAVFIGFTGVLIMTGFSPAIPLIGLFLGICGAFFNASVQIALRSLAFTEHPLTTAFYFLLFGFVATAPIFPFVSSGTYTLEMVPYIGALAVFGSIQHITKNSIYVHLPAAVAAPFPYSALIWAALFDFTIWGYIPDWSIIVGGSIVIFSNLFIIYREHKNAERKSGVFNQ